MAAVLQTMVEVRYALEAKDKKMTTVQEVQKAIAELRPAELSRFRAWFEKFNASVWDKQFEEDVKAGRLDTIAQKALNDLKNGECRSL